MEQGVLCIILGGGRGTRLFPLTRDRAKPAVPLFGKYRLIDIPISNCLNSGLNKIKVLTQFNSESLNKHITRTYKFDQFSSGYIEVIAADQSMENMNWFEGPADAVRKTLRHFTNPKIKHVCILSGDQLYKMDLRRLMQRHLDTGAEITIACNVVGAAEVSAFGIMGLDEKGRICKFVEKPKDQDLIKDLSLKGHREESYLCSMGIYFFDRDVLEDVLTYNTKPDFGKEVIPDAIREKKVYAYEFEGYWRDIGTIKSFYHENLLLTQEHAPLELFDEDWQIYTRSRSLPPAKYGDCAIERSIVADGSIISSGSIRRSIIGLRSKIHEGTVIEDSILMGADYYETVVPSKISLGIGANCEIRKAIIDKNVRIGDGVRIINQAGLESGEGPHHVIRDGIVIVYKNAVIPPGTVI